ncbi:MAG TPA: hypothetical protein VGM05_22340 [Planctomycetaceae bacterium]|jgi:hypothetical protein
MENSFLTPVVLAHSLSEIWYFLGMIALVTCGIPLAALPFAIYFRAARKADKKGRQQDPDNN